MAREKSSKGKMVAMPVSPENYIRSGRARKLPIHECVVLKDWQDLGTTMVLVARKHVNGNVTGAYFLVDIWCLGVKDTFPFVNLSEEEYETGFKLQYQQEGIALEYIDYPVAHTLIYGAVAFADKFGFRPHKRFQDCRFVLAPEEEVPIAGVEFGKEGKPLYMATEDDPAKIDRVITTLERTAGPGNFDFIAAFDDDDEFDDQDEFLGDDADFDADGFEDADEFDDEELRLGRRHINEIFPEEDRDAIVRGEKVANPIQAFYLADELYSRSFPEERKELPPNITALEEAFDEMTDTPEAILSDDEEDPGLGRATDLMMEGKIAEAVRVVEQASAKEPHALYPYQFRCLMTGLFDAPLPENVFDGFLSAFAGSPLAKLLKAYRLILVGKPEEGFDMMGRTDNIMQAFPEKYGVFFEEEIDFFHIVLCAYYTRTGQLTRASMIAHEVLYFADLDDFNLIGCLQPLARELYGKVVEKSGDAPS